MILGQVNSYIDGVTFLTSVSLPYLPYQYQLMTSFFNPSLITLYHSWFLMLKLFHVWPVRISSIWVLGHFDGSLRCPWISNIRLLGWSFSCHISPGPLLVLAENSTEKPRSGFWTSLRLLRDSSF